MGLLGDRMRHREHHDPGLRQLRAQRRQELEAALTRHLIVEEDHVRTERARELQPVHRVDGAQARIGLDERADAFAHGGAVVDEEHAARLADPRPAAPPRRLRRLRAQRVRELVLRDRALVEQDLAQRHAVAVLLARGLLIERPFELMRGERPLVHEPEPEMPASDLDAEDIADRPDQVDRAERLEHHRRAHRGRARPLHRVERAGEHDDRHLLQLR